MKNGPPRTMRTKRTPGAHAPSAELWQSRKQLIQERFFRFFSFFCCRLRSDTCAVILRLAQPSRSVSIFVPPPPGCAALCGSGLAAGPSEPMPAASRAAKVFCKATRSAASGGAPDAPLRVWRARRPLRTAAASVWESSAAGAMCPGSGARRTPPASRSKSCTTVVIGTGAARSRSSGKPEQREAGAGAGARRKQGAGAEWAGA